MTAVGQPSSSSKGESKFVIKAATTKFDTREELLPHIEPLIDNPDVEEVHLSGNTYGIEVCKFLGEVLSAKKNLKVLPLRDACETRVPEIQSIC